MRTIAISHIQGASKVVSVYYLVWLGWPETRLQTNRGYEKTNTNTDLYWVIFVSYNRNRISADAIRFCLNTNTDFCNPHSVS